MEKITIDVFELQGQIYALLESNTKENAKSGLHELLGAIKDGLMINRIIIVFRHEQSLFNLVGKEVSVLAPAENRHAIHSFEFQGTVHSVFPDKNYATIIDQEDNYFDVDFDLIEPITGKD
jgi:hypothetical protein